MSDHVRVWIVPVDVSPGIMARCRDVLDDGERARAAAFLSPSERRQFTLAHGALRILVGHELKVHPGTLAWIPGRHGKPQLVLPRRNVHTSLSHSEEVIAAAISTDRPVGLDIQHLIPGLDVLGLSSRFFPPDEATYVASGSNARVRAGRFAILWTRKEAVVKAAGERLWANLNIAVRGREIVAGAETAHSYRVADVAAPASYRGAVALAGPAPFVVDSISWSIEVAALAIDD